ncbi:MAG: hypothetical protein WDA02_05990 [Saccharofermentanales bacterium]
MSLKKVNIPYLLLAVTYIVYYFTHLPELYILIGLTYGFLAFRHH